MSMTNDDVTWPIQVAVKAALEGDAPLAAAVEDVWDEAPEETPFPYLTLGPFTSVPDYTHSNFGASTYVDVHVWSTYSGNAELGPIVGHIIRVLDHKALSLVGHILTALRWDTTVQVPDTDTDVRHAMVRFIAITEAV